MSTVCVGARMPVDARNFPHPSWAWPKGELDRLLTAVIAPDENVALSAARHWFANNDINDVDFREHRLLTAVAARFGRKLSDLAEFPRLIGLQRLLWTKSRMALREATPALKKMSVLGVQIILFKGAARLALSEEDQKARVSHDIDVIVPPLHIGDALDVLVQSGWTPSSGESALSLRARIADLDAINLFFGRFGDIDLHQWGYGPGERNAVAERGLWSNAQQAELFGVPVLVPAAEDRLALTLKSSALDAHIHSDWLVDCAQVLASDRLNAARLAERLEDQGLTIQAEIAFSYLAERIGLKIPDLSELKKINCKIPTSRRASILFQSKPRTDWTLATRLMRGLAKAQRMRRRAIDFPQSARRVPKFTGVFRGRCPAMDEKLVQPLGWGTPEQSGEYRVSVRLAVQLNGSRRRYEFELNTDRTHIIRLRARDLWGRRGWHEIAFNTAITLREKPGQWWIEARPARNIASDDSKQIARYSAVPFALVEFRSDAVK